MFSPRRKTFSLCCWLCAILGAMLCWFMLNSESIAWADDVPEKPSAKSASKKEPRYERRKKHDPNGTGKFYMGREIALVMGFPAATWLERSEREEEERISLMVKSLKLEPGMTVADIGAGSGRISFLMAEAVTATGKVLAVDIQQEMLDLIAEKISLRDVKNVELIKGSEKSPNLPIAAVDLAIMVDVYHEFAFPYEMMRDLSTAMKPGGRVVLVEFRKEDVDVPIKLIHKMTEAQVKKELLLPEYHLQWKETIGVLPWQHIIVFEKQPAADSASP